LRAQSKKFASGPFLFFDKNKKVCNIILLEISQLKEEWRRMDQFTTKSKTKRDQHKMRKTFQSRAQAKM
jgi:hypothetical protein